MSKTLDFIKSHNFGCRIHGYDDEEKCNLKDVLELELIELGNVDIPYYLEDNKIIDLDVYNITEEEFLQMKEAFYEKWLNVNGFIDTESALKIYKMDCNMNKHQYYVKNIINDIITGIEEELDCKSDFINTIWLNSCTKEDKIIHTVPNEYVVLSDMNELGVLIAYNNSNI